MYTYVQKLIFAVERGPLIFLKTLYNIRVCFYVYDIHFRLLYVNIITKVLKQ